MTSNKNTMSMPETAPVPAPTTGGEALTKRSPPLDIRSTVLNPSSTDTTTTLALFYYEPRKNPTPDATNNLVDPTESFKTSVNDIIEAIIFLIATMPYETETMLIHTEELRQEINNAAAKYQVSMPHLKTHLLCVIFYPLNILTGHLKDHQHHTYTSLNINPYLKAEANLKPHRFQTTNNNMTDTVTPTTPGGSHTTPSSSDVFITDMMKMHLSKFTPFDVYFTTNMAKPPPPPPFPR